MVGLVITIAQRKGGAGRTTSPLAVTWARRGARVAALDIDPQGSFSASRLKTLGSRSGVGSDRSASQHDYRNSRLV
jgi:cellulose biosynthesis protein BcsQ